MGNTDSDLGQINALVKAFFSLFTNTNGQVPKVGAIKEKFIPEGLLINNSSDALVSYTLDSFIEPRVVMLTNGTLTEFEEKEAEAETHVNGNIATRICCYEKAGVLNQTPFKGAGTKYMHFVKLNDKWLFSSVLWTDDI